MKCHEQQSLLNEEQCAWNAYKALRDSSGYDKHEITRRADEAGLVSSRLREHLSTCRICRALAGVRGRTIAMGCDNDFSTVGSPDSAAVLAHHSQ